MAALAMRRDRQGLDFSVPCSTRPSAYPASLRCADHTIVGAWTCIGSPEVISATRISASSKSLPGALQVRCNFSKRPKAVRAATARRIARAMPKSADWRSQWRPLFVAAGLCLPVPYNVGAHCELQPDVRRFVAAPHAGEFQKSLVKPGDIVAKGQVLARTGRPRGARELAGVVAEQEHARKLRDVNMAAGKTAAAQIDQLETQRQEVKRQLLERRLANLEIKSPVDGIVVTGDLDAPEGVPVSVGQVLYRSCAAGPDDRRVGHRR